MKKILLVFVIVVVLAVARGAISVEAGETDWQEEALKARLEVAVLKATVSEQQKTIELLKAALGRENAAERRTIVLPAKQALGAYLKEKKAHEQEDVKKMDSGK